MDVTRFNAAVTRARLRKKDGIGMLGEKLLHSALKYYIEPNELCHEIKVGGYYADILNEDGITEVQTGSLYPLLPKLRAYLADGCTVTVVYPMARRKKLYWIDPLTGETTVGRSVVSKKGVIDAFCELVYLREVLCDPRLTMRIIFLDIEEYKLLTGRSRDRKRWGASKFERIPTAIEGETLLCGGADYISLLPNDLPQEFTTAELAAALKASSKAASAMARTLLDMGLLRRTGKRERFYLYTKN